MARGIDITEMIAIDEITAHDGTVTAITEEEMKGGNEMIDETGPGETATGIAIVGTTIAEGVLRMPMSDAIVLPSLHVVHPILHPVCERRLTPTGKRASEYRSSLVMFGFDTHTPRISPHPSRGSSPAPRKNRTTLESNTPLNAPPPNPAPSTQPDAEIELTTSPVPVEVTLAARRAKRQAILAKYAGVASVNTTEASPSPGPSSAVQPPPPSAVVSDPQSQRHSIIGENGVGSTSRDQSAGPLSKSPHTLSPEFTLNIVTLDRRESQSASPAPDIFELAKGGEEEGAQAEAQEQAKRDGAREQISAADYDPSLDRREDEQRRVRGAKEDLNQDVEMIEEEEEEEEDVDDMFAVSVADKKKKIKKVKKVIVSLMLIFYP
jgi:serine/threonine-protein kinase PRP4